MNKQIEEIALQSKLGGSDFGNGVKYYVGTEETFNNFAESIVFVYISFYLLPGHYLFNTLFQEIIPPDAASES
jgi:hypothetical protein